MLGWAGGTSASRAMTHDSWWLEREGGAHDGCSIEGGWRGGEGAHRCRCRVCVGGGGGSHVREVECMPRGGGITHAEGDACVYCVGLTGAEGMGWVWGGWAGGGSQAQSASYLHHAIPATWRSHPQPSGGCGRCDAAHSCPLHWTPAAPGGPGEGSEGRAGLPPPPCCLSRPRARVWSSDSRQPGRLVG